VVNLASISTPRGLGRERTSISIPSKWRLARSQEPLELGQTGIATGSIYAAVALALANILLWFVTPWPETGLQTLIFFFVLFAAGFAMWRVWREEHTYGY
jgi:Flp pilus assembly protein TadB